MERRERIPPPTPPGAAPEKPAITYASLLGKPATLDAAGLTGPTAPASTGPLELHAAGTSPLKLERTEGAAAVLTVLRIARNGSVKGYIGLDASDQLALIAADGTTVLASLTNTGELDVLLRLKTVHLEATTDTKTPKVLDGSGNQVVSTRGAAVADASTSSASGNTSAGTGTNAAANPPTQTEFNALVAVVNANATASNANGTAINALVTDLNAAIGKLNTLLARLRAATGHGLIS